MPAQIWGVQDTQTNLWLTSYFTQLSNCKWGDAIDAQDFGTKTGAEGAITSWGQIPGQRFIGNNPPLHH